MPRAIILAVSVGGLFWALLSEVRAELPRFPKGTNKILQSQNPAGWDVAGVGAVIGSQTQTDPAGAVTAFTVTTPSGWIYQNTGALLSSTTYTESVWVKCNLASCSFKLARTNCVSWVGATASPVFIASTYWQLFSTTYTTEASITCSGINALGEDLTHYRPTPATYTIAWAQVNPGLRVLPYHRTTGTAKTWSARYRRGF
jgi:hypothetical protein